MKDKSIGTAIQGERLEIQVDKSHYDFLKYTDVKRWISYYTQIAETLKANAGSVLLIGVGDAIVPTVLRKLNVNVTTLDFDPSLEPDIVGDVTKMGSCVTAKYDAIVCCQVLEHIPFEKFSVSLENIAKALNGNGRLILSLPNQKRKGLLWAANHKAFEFDGEHYWEVNAVGYSREMVTGRIGKFFHIEKSFVLKENTYHMFFICTAKTEAPPAGSAPDED